LLVIPSLAYHLVQPPCQPAGHRCFGDFASALQHTFVTYAMNWTKMIDRWPKVSVVLVLAQVTVSLLWGSGTVLAGYSNITYLLLILIATALAARNALHETHARGFWALLTAGFALWTFSTLIWTYYVVGLRENVPNLGLTDPPIFLHTVLFMAAVALGPHLRLSKQEQRQSGLDLILLLGCWAFLYAYVQLPSQARPQALDSFTVLYTVENLLLIATLGILWLRTESHAWRIIYGQMFGATSLYLFASVATNLILSVTGSESGLVDVLLTAAACWFVWIPLLGWRMSSELGQRRHPGSGNPRLVKLTAVLALIVISLVGIWGMRGHWVSEEREFRLTVVLVSALLIALVVATRDYFDRDKLATDLSGLLAVQSQLKAERLELGGRLIQAQEAERARIARDLHDDINQRIAILTNSLRGIEEELRDSRVRQKLHESVEQVEQISLDIQQLSRRLHSSQLQYLGLVAAVRSLCEEFARENKASVEWDIQDSANGLDAETSLALFRTLQEGLNNVAKHSHATLVGVELSRNDSAIKLQLSDNGEGFDCNRKHGGLGLISMRERMRLVGGTLEVWSQPSRGTRVEAIVPVPELKKHLVIAVA
jgi:signal transduction histidine kinase